MEGRDETTKEIILKLQQQEENCRWWSDQEKQKAARNWRALSEQNESDTPSHILYLSKVLELGWNGEVAITLADKCHQLVQEQHYPKTQIKLAYRGFATLGVKLKEPDYNLHTKLHAVPQVIHLLKDLKASTASIQSAADLSLPLYNTIFHEDCIPQAEICTLLTVAYGGKLMLGADNRFSSALNIFNNGKEAIALYQEGLKGQTTPKQREYYHSQIVNLVYGFSRTPTKLYLSENEHYLNLRKKSALALARLYKDKCEESENTLTRTDLAYKTALAYRNAGKENKALKYIGIVSDEPQEESERGLYIKRIQTRAELLRLQIEDPKMALSYAMQNANVFPGQW